MKISKDDERQIKNHAKKTRLSEAATGSLAKDVSYPVGEEKLTFEPDEEPAPYNP